MINALIVDDENLVRKWLIFSLKGSESGIRVVGDVPSGEKALAFLAENDVQLVLTDLTMPSMSGFELMGEIRERFPHIRFVVLTCHQDFHYIQDAMRLGAIDYIVKTQLEQEQVEDVLKRIAERIERERAARAESATKEPDCGILLVSEGGTNSDSADLPPPEWGRVVRIEPGAWWLPRPSAEVLRKKAAEDNAGEKSGDWLAFRIEGSHALQEIEPRKLKAWKDDVLFYWGGQSSSWVSVGSVGGGLLSGGAEAEAARIKQVRDPWTSYDWLLEDAAFARLVDAVRTQAPRRAFMEGLLRSAASDWSHLKAIPGASDWPSLTKGYRYWTEWQEWLRKARASICAHAGKCSFSPDIFTAIFKAVGLMGESLEEGLHQGEIAQRVNLSRGYFSDCFKEAAGKSFSEFMKELKIDKAKELLRGTMEPIYWISLKTGFQDEKYFSRVFKDNAGMLPSEYRARSRKGAAGTEGD